MVDISFPVERGRELRTFVQSAPIAFAMFDIEMRYLAASERWRRDYGLGDRNIIGQCHYDVFPEIGEDWKAAHRRALAGETVRADEDSFKRADGSLQWLRWSIHPWHAAEGEVGGILIYSEDITSTKRIEVADRHLTNVLAAMRSINALIATAKNEDALLENACSILTESYGYRSAWGFLQDKSGTVHFVAESRVGKIFDAMRERMERGIYPSCYGQAAAAPDLVTIHNTRLDCRDCVFADNHGGSAVLIGMLRHEGQTFGMLVVSLHDSQSADSEERILFREVVTGIGYSLDAMDRERKRAQAIDALKMSEHRFRAMFEQAEIGLAIVGLDKRLLRVNQRLCDIFGRSVEALRNASLPEVLRFDEDGDLESRFDSLASGAVQTFSIERRRSRSGRPDAWVNFTASLVLDQGGRPAYFLVIIQDITDRRTAEAEALADKTKLQSALESMTDAVFISDREARFIDFNEAFATFHKFKSKKECATTLAEYSEFLEVFTADGRPAPLDDWAVPRALRGEIGSAVEYSLRRKDTGEAWVGSYSFSPIRSESGDIVGSVVVGRDITEIKRVANELRESERRFSTVFHASPAAIGISRLDDGAILDVNDAFLRLLGYERAELIGRTTEELRLWVSAIRSEVTRELREKAHIENAEMVARRKDGSLRSLLASMELVDLGGERCLLGILTDITDQKLAEDRIRQALREKETLLAELYHRTKNNMLILASMMSIQASAHPEQSLGDFTEALRQRIMAMALVHEKLYQSRDLSRIDLGEYLADLTVKTISDAGKANEVRLSTELEAVPVLLESAQTIALVMNELLINSLHHAFPRDRSGNIAIRLSRTDDGTIQVVFSDDGVGIPDGFEIEGQTGYGLGLVNLLVTHQLHGSISV
jgi:PAS domain S-box-containing protein